ncbi:MCE family protein [Mycobacterium sp. ITM-2016-00317]|uniref:MlaD family protein n=1 Tax=Mycobacterium sp. ITM-2016-00317 TaxID=2099694 RepID=UPI00287F7C37|nr:MCE family protein [Mycobacterium sp. ITM-2016-00317]WNG89255.1 MCE family protein [Mycobacterium sp. ITM-2016-00317]
MNVLRSAVGFARTRRLGLSACALAMMFVVGVAYVLFGTLKLDPTRSDTLVRVHLPVTGGLLPGQDVTLRGVPVGRVRSVDMTSDGVVAVAAIHPDVRVPADTHARVSALSPAGEQYLDFRADRNDGPYLADGDEIASDRTQTPVTLPTLLADLDGTLQQVDTEQLAAVLDELRVGPQGGQKLAAILDGGAFLVSTLDSVLPQTVRLIRSSKVVLSTVHDVSPGLEATSTNLDSILGGVERMDGGYRTLVDSAPTTFAGIDDLIADNSPTMVQLLGNLTTVAQQSYIRVPALQELFFPQYRAGSALEAVASTFRDGGVWGAVNLYPRHSCDFNLPKSPPTVGDFPEPYLYTYCLNPDPKYLVRGARSVPVPPGADTAGPPPGANPLQRADPTPTGPLTIPTPYAGPNLPLPPTPRGP